MAAQNDEDRSDPIQNPERTYAWLRIDWDDAHNPANTSISVTMKVYNIPPYHYAVIEDSSADGRDAHEYKIVLRSKTTGDPKVHNQDLKDISPLVGRPKTVYAGVNGQTGSARATTVAL